MIAMLTLFGGCAQDSSSPSPEAASNASATSEGSTDASTASQLVASTESSSSEETDHSSDLLIVVDDLKKWLDDPKLRILDARPRSDYEEGHIAGAVHVDLSDWKSQALADGGLVDEAIWSEKVGSLGIDSEKRVVVYAHKPTDATRIWWTLKYLGHGKAGVLDGGWSEWNNGGGDTSSEVPQIDRTEFQPQFESDRLAIIDDLKQSLGSGDLAIVDARTRAEFDGSSGSAQRLGRVPGAVHLEWVELLDEQGRFKTKDELVALFKERGIGHQQTAVTYCQSGGRASLNAFALELAGYSKVKNYYCSWQEWSADDEAPVEK